MSGRDARLAAFLGRTDWADAARVPLAGDASNRRYERLRAPSGATAVLMDAPPERGEDVRPFLRIARHLRGIGLSAPEILAEDADGGFLILEDLGDDLYSRVLARAPELESRLYEAATDVLATLHAAETIPLESYDVPRMTDLAALAFTKYAGPLGAAPPDAFHAAFADLLAGAVAGAREVLIQRDYHADNLLWLPERAGVARVGLLDFQDAMAGHPAYDLASLLQDVRREVAPATEAAMVARYLDATGTDGPAFRRAYAVLGVQRALRILGVFGRLGLDYGKPHYVDMIPRVWAVLQRGLDDPALAPVAPMLRDALPPPAPANLARLKRT